MIEKRFTTQFTMKRMVWTGDSSSLVDSASFKGHLQQTSVELAQNLGLSFTKSFSIWCSLNTDVKAGDELYNDEVQYTVKEIQELLIGGNKHKQLIVERTESYG